MEYASSLVGDFMRRFLTKYFCNNKGFTFIETILTTLVLSVGLWGGFAIFHNATINSFNNDFRVIATQLAAEKIETITADKSFRGYDYVTGSNYPGETLGGAYNGFTRSVNITEVSSSDFNTVETGSGYKRVDVLVTWGAESFEVITVSTVLSDYS